MQEALRPQKGEDLLDLFERICRACPDEPAVEGRGTRLSYRELDRAARRLAERLAAAGIAPADPVALLCPDPVAWIVSILACLRTGAAFAPLDPEWPGARLREVLADLAPAALLADAGAEGVDELAPLVPRVLRVDPDGSAADDPEDAPRAAVDPDALCYVYYTSGSTGRPKGIAGRRKGLSHFIRWEIEQLGVTPGTRVAQLVAPAFDASLRDLFVPLGAGGTVCLPPARAGALDPGRLARWIDESGVHLLHSVPSLFRAITRASPGPGVFAALRWILLAGEELRPEDVRAWRELHGERTMLVNLYGSTETTMVKLFHVVAPEDLERGFIPIGKPMAGARALLLHDDLTPCRAGVVGEIYLRSPFLTLGYYRQPERTREVFVPNPFSQDPQDLVFKTGDLARMLEDGSFQFLGRKDGLVKVRGVRIELGEIESCLLRHTGVREAVVAAREDRPGDVRLAAYVVPAEGSCPEPDELRTHLRRSLPAAMIPADFVVLDRLPLTSNGKVDRQALPVPERPGGSGEEPGAGPVEEMVAALWAEVLQVERVGRRDDFFELGGHSLLATQLIARGRDLFGVEVPLRRLLETPTVAGMAGAVLEALATDGSRSLPRVARVSREAPLPLSFAQERLWFLDRLQPGRTAYHISAAVRLEGRLDRGALAAALAGVADRHEALRTRFVEVDGRPRQAVDAAAPLPLPEVDLRALPMELRDGAARGLAAVWAGVPFALDRGPLLRAVLLRRDGEDALLVLAMHHIVSDAWSVGRLIREVAELYRAAREGGAPDLPELRVQYGDWAACQREWLGGEALAPLLAWWRERLAGLPEVLEVPADRPRPAVRGDRGKSLPLALGPELSARLAALCRTRRLTPFVPLLAAFATVLHRLTGAEALPVGTPVAGRRQTELEPLIGLFVNTLVLRVDLDGDLTGGALLDRLREELLGAWAHQDLPFERLVEELRPQRSLAHTPLFQVMLALQNVPRAPLALPELRLTPVDVERGRAHFDLTLRLSEEEGGLAGLLESSAELFDEATAARLLGSFATLLAGLVDVPDRPLHDLPLLSEAERHQIRVEWNDTEPAAAPFRAVPELFRAQAETTPAATAVSRGDEAWTYAELLDRVEQLARWLAARGCGPEVPVGVCLERSPDMVAAVLGVLAAGGAFLPLDPSLPAARLSFLLADAGAPLVVTRRGLAGRLGSGSAELLCVEDPHPLAPSPTRIHARPGEGEWEPESLAYILHTSGSTGAPKGVMVPHRGLANYLRWAGEAYGAGAGGAPLHSSIGFDLSLTSLFLPLLSGGEVRLVPEGDDVEALGRELAERGGLDLVKVTPAHLDLLARSLPAGRAAAAARTLVVGGEALTAERLAFWRENAPRVRVVNEYGPTETVVGCAAFAFAAGERAAGPVPIGRPVAGARLQVLDGRLRPLPALAVGEIYIGGPGVARGYVGRPDLTAERFVPDGGGAAPGERLYRTGDLARWLPGGLLEYLGRADHQVKVRGYRIEPDEIAAVLAGHPGARDAVVVLREDRPGDPRLAGYWVAAEETEPAEPELRAFLAERLPSYMVPPDLVRLDALPLTPGGKVDRKALPAPGRAAVAGAAAAPRNELEEVLAGLWSQALGRPWRDIHADFFAWGGHSLLAVQLLARVHRELRVELPLRSLFDGPTVAAQAAAVERALRESAGLDAPPLVPVPRDGDPPLSFGQERLWFLQRLDPESAAYNVLGGLRLDGALAVAALRRALAAVVDRHEALRTRFAEIGGRAVQRISSSLSIPLPVIDLADLPEAARTAEAARLAAAEGGRPFDLERGPLLRAVLVRQGEDVHLLLLTLHHAVSDAASIAILGRELAAFYESFRTGAAAVLPELPVQGADWAVWQRRMLSGERLERLLAAWQEELAGAPTVLDLPADRPRPAVRSARGGRWREGLPPSAAEAVRRLGAAEGATPFMTFLAAFFALLGRVTGRDDLLVGAPVSQRDRLELEGLIGFFVNTIVLRGRLGGAPTFRAVLGRVRSAALAAFTHRDLPFARLVDALELERSLSHDPLYQVGFSLQGAPPQPAALPGLSLTPVARDGDAAKEDLALALGEQGAGVEIVWDYAADLFDPASVVRLAGHFRTLLAAAAADPDLPLAELPLLAEAERHQIIREWNAPSSAPPPGLLHDLVLSQARRTPDAVALIQGEEQVTFGEIGRRARRLAARLRALGVEPEMPVAVYLHGSPDSVAALLGVMAAGGVYVPIEPAYPEARRTYMLRDAGARIVVTRRELLGSWSVLKEPGIEAVTLTSLPPLPVEGGAMGEGSRGGEVGPRHLAYIIYTSGSTGQPKPVGVEHGPAAGHFADMVREWRMTAADRALQMSPMSFDGYLEDVLTALAAGGSVLLRDVEPWGAAELLERLVAHQVTVAIPAMAYLQRWVQEWSAGDPALLSGLVLRLICPGSEPMDPTMARRWIDLCAEARCPGELVNGYGPTEAIVTATLYTVTPDVLGPHLGGSVPIGRPFGSRTAYVLDATGALLPAGAPGELCVGGMLARGYLGRPALTAERFIPHPWSGRPGDRLYRTGDLVRQRPDGAFQMLGRLDGQVKVRGYRVETGEIEAELAAVPGVARAAVVVRELPQGGRALVAYVVPEPPAAPSARELREALQSRLPLHMIPSVFMVLEDLPLTPIGKVDRRALPAPDVRALTAEAVEAAPRSPEERTLAAIWRDLLHLDDVGLHDDFFALGGDSILAIQIVSRANQAGLRLAARDLFAHPTLAGLAAAAAAAGPAVPRAVSNAPVEGPVRPTPVLARFFAEDPVDPWHFDQSLLLEVARGELSPARIAVAAAALVEHHDALRLRFARGPGGWEARNAGLREAGPAPAAWADLSALPEPRRVPEAARQAALIQGGFDLAAGPLFRITVFDTGGPWALGHLAAHHLVVDGVSWRVLLEDLDAALRRLAAGEPVELPAKTTSFQEWAKRLARHAATPEAEADRAYWESLPWESLLALPADDPRAADTAGSAAVAQASLGEEETRALLQRLPPFDRTRPDEILLAALAQALAEWLGDGAVAVELEGHGREDLFEDVDLSRTVGWLTALHPVLLPLRRDRPPGAALAAVKESLRGIPGRGLGWGLLRAGLAGLPEPEISFNYLGQLDQGLPASSRFRPSPLSPGPAQSPRQRRWSRLEIQASVLGGRLRLAVTYGSLVYWRATMEHLIGRLAAALRDVLDALAGGLVPSDFPLAGVDAATLERCLAAPGDLEDLYPLSPLQAGLLFQTLDDPVPGHDMHVLEAEIRGPFEPEAFARAWQHLVDRHAMLRTVFLWEGLDRPLQKVLRRVQVPLEREDWSGLPAAETARRLEELRTAERRLRFDPARAPLLRLRVVRTGADVWRFVWPHHQLLLDGWSAPLLLRELFAAYRALRRGEAPAGGPVVPYREYVAWLERRDLAAAEAWWRRTLSGVTATSVVSLPPPASVATATRGEREIALTAEATAALRRSARALRLTLNTLVQGAWALALARHGGGEDVVFGAVTSGRPADLPGADAILGVLINTLPLRARIRPDDEVAAWLAGLQAQQAEAREHEHAPLVQVQRWSGVPAGQPLFEALMAFENFPIDEALREPDPELTIGDVRFSEASHDPLTLVASPQERLGLRLLYDAARFDGSAVLRLLVHLEMLLAALAAAPGRRLADLPALPEAERWQVLAEWNDTGAAAADACLHDLVFAQARRTPDAWAVIGRDHRLTYAELATEAERLARRLRARGVGPEVPVGVRVERSPEMVVAVLAVLAAGGAYVPLDPAYPEERLRLIAEDAGVEVVLDWTDRSDRSDRSDDPSDQSDPPGAAVAPGNLAYLIYTSGSTGRPKGVAITHASAVALVRWAWRTFSPEETAGVLASTSLSFDLSVFELFVPLSRGGMVVVAENALELPSHPAVGEVTLVNSVPSAAAELVRSGGIPPSVRTVALAGEPLPGSLVDRLYERTAAGAVYNLYGPSEDTTYSTFSRVPPGTGKPAIGRPVEATRAYVVDRGLAPLPLGVPGELCLGGAGLARGYHGRPDLTAERFVPDPFAAGPGSRLYRTGDLARWRTDGELEFLGRLDHQIKLRGFRIELEEIEAALRAHPGVQDAAVVVAGVEPAPRRLVAWFVAAPEEDRPEPEELRTFLAGRLPAYMVPAVCMPIAELPLTPNGKVDRRDLASRGAEAPAAGFAEPSEAVERALAAIWQRVLRVERVGAHDSFFALGGDSILCLQVVSQARQAGLPLTSRQVFAHPVLADLAREVAVAGGVVLAEDEVLAGPVGLTPAQRRFWEMDLPDAHHWNQALLFAADARPDLGLLARCLAALLVHHDALRLRFRRTGDGWMQEIAAPGGPPPLAEVDLSGVPAGEQARLVEAVCAAAQTSLDLEAGPLLRAVWLDLGPGRGGRLLLAIHHLAVDGVSWRVLLEDLEILHRGERLPAKTSSLRRWVEALEDRVRSGGLDAELEHWLLLARDGAAPLPRDVSGGPDGRNLAALADGLAVELAPEETRSLVQDLPARLRVRVDEILLAALVLACRDWTGSERLLLELEGHGREDLGVEADVSRTVGWLTSFYPVLLDLGQASGPEEALKRTKEQLRRIPGRGLGYGLLRSFGEPGTRQRLGAMARPEVVFNYLGQLDAALSEESWLRPAPESPGPGRSPRQPRAHLLEINASVVRGRLEVVWTWGTELHRRATVERLAAGFVAWLRELLALGGSESATGFTPSDFPEMDFVQEELDELLAELDQAVQEGER